MIGLEKALPQWLEMLRYREIVERVTNDHRSVGETVFGIDLDTAQREVLEYGRADFDKPWRNLTPDDRVLVYSYLNQRGHLEELVEAFRQHYVENDPPDETVLIDLGCGPCTGGLAFASVFSDNPRFEYIGVDQSHTMCGLGERLASTVTQMDQVRRQWNADIPSVSWNDAPGWRPVFVVVSYLLASSTLIPAILIDQLDCLLRKIGNGPVTVLYTNSPQPIANRSFPEFCDALTGVGFALYADDEGEIKIRRHRGTTQRALRYALFYRQTQKTLRLGG